MLSSLSSLWRPRCASPAFSADGERCSISTAATQRCASHGRKPSRRRRGERRPPPPLCPRTLDRLSSSSLAPPRSSFGGGSFIDPSEGLADAAEDLLRALRAEPEGGSGSGSGGGGGGAATGRRADELASDGMWPLYQALGDFANLLDLAGKGVGSGGSESGGDDDGDGDGGEGGDSSLGGASADAAALALLRSHPSLLLLPRSELARRLVLLKLAAGPGADAAALARKLPWLLAHADPGEVVRRASKQMLALMPGVGGARELGARLFGSSGGGGKGSGGKKKRRSSDGRASQSWLTFCDIARGESRKLKVEEKAEREKEAERDERERAQER